MIDREGRVILQPEFDLISQFRNGLAQLIVGEKIGYANGAGRVVWPPRS